MGSSLQIEPEDREKKVLSYELKSALRKSCDASVNKIYDDQDMSYFLGLYHAGIEDAKIVLEMIGKHGRVRISEEY